MPSLPQHITLRWIFPAACAAALLLSTLAQAAPFEEKVEPGFKGSLRLFTGVDSSRSLTRVSDENKTIATLSQKATSEDSAAAFPFASFEYTLSNRATSFYVDNGRVPAVEGLFLFEFGARQRVTADTTISLAYTPNLDLFDDEVWKDPYLTGSPRSETTRESQAVAIDIETVAGLPVFFRYTFASQKIQDEDSGESLLASGALSEKEMALLRRDAKTHALETGVTLPLSETVLLQTDLLFARTRAEGEAMRFKSMGASMRLMLPKKRHRFFASIAFATDLYDASHPVFDTRRNDKVYRGELGVEIPHPFGMERISLLATIGGFERHSNIDFYNAQGYSLGTGISWQF